MQNVQAIDRALPILHSGPGCAQKLSDTNGSSGYFSPNIFPCTSINEKDVVFGGVVLGHVDDVAGLQLHVPALAGQDAVHVHLVELRV